MGVFLYGRSFASAVSGVLGIYPPGWNFFRILLGRGWGLTLFVFFFGWCGVESYGEAELCLAV